VLVCLLIALGAGFQIANSNRYKNHGPIKKILYWQMVWRNAKSSKRNDSLDIPVPRKPYYTGPALGAQINWTYGDTNVSNEKIITIS
jgi:hypothetical protein